MTRSAFDNLLCEHYNWLLSRCITATGSKVEGEELAQATCLRAIENYDKFLGSDKNEFEKWLYTVMKNKWYNILEKEQYHPTSMTYSQPVDDDDDDSEVFDRTDVREDMDERMYDLAAALNTLGESYKQAILLYAEGYSQQEIADKMNISTANVNNLVHRSKAKIKAYYAA